LATERIAAVSSRAATSSRSSSNKPEYVSSVIAADACSRRGSQRQGSTADAGPWWCRRRSCRSSPNAHYTPNREAILRGRTSARYVAEHLPGAKIVKAFNQLPANTLQAEIDPEVGRRVIFIATDYPEAGDEIADLVGNLGLAAVQLGRIEEGGQVIQAPNALVLRNLIERPLV